MLISKPAILLTVLAPAALAAPTSDPLSHLSSEPAEPVVNKGWLDGLLSFFSSHTKKRVDAADYTIYNYVDYGAYGSYGDYSIHPAPKPSTSSTTGWDTTLPTVPVATPTPTESSILIPPAVPTDSESEATTTVSLTLPATTATLSLQSGPVEPSEVLKAPVTIDR